MQPAIFKSRDLRWWVFALLWFASWHLLINYSVWQSPLYRVPGPIGDNTVMLWNIGWVKHALDRGSLGYWFTNAYYPDGFFFLYGTPTWLDGFLYWIVSPLLPGNYTGAILFANINMLLATVASGLAVTGGLRAWGVRHWPVLLLMSSAVAFSWFRVFASSGHYHFHGTHWMLFSLCAISWARRAALEDNKTLFYRRCAAAGIILGITFLNDQAMTIFAALLGSIIVASTVIRNPRPAAFGWLIFVACSLAVAAVHLVPTIAAIATGKVDYFVDKSPRLVDATSLVLPPQWHTVGQFIQPWREAHGLHWSEGTYLGIIPMITLLITTSATIALLSKRATRSPGTKVAASACALAWLFIICALGDKLLVGQHQVITFPGRILKEIPVLNNIRLPQRWVWPAHLCLALSGAVLLEMWMTRPPSNGGIKATRLAPILLALAVIPPLEGFRYPPEPPPLDYAADTYLRPPALVEKIAELHTGGSLLVMPAQKGPGHANIFQFLLGYDFPTALNYTARMPVNPSELPWKDSRWTPEAGEWLRQKRVQILAFAYDDGSAAEYAAWVQEAKKAVPGLIALDREGNLL
jgi:hypothetical protein